MVHELELHDVNPACSCIKGDTKIFLLSKFKLVADTKAMFIVWDPVKQEIINNNPAILRGLRQPTDSGVFNQDVLIFTAPPQDPKLLRDEIIDKGYVLRITAWRSSDGRLSKTSFEFKYYLHGTGNCSERSQNLTCLPSSTSARSTEKDGHESFRKKSTDDDEACLICDLLAIKLHKIIIIIKIIS